MMSSSRAANFIFLFGLVFLAPTNHAHPADPAPKRLCEVITNAKLFDGQVVDIEATYRVGLEFSELYCLDCLEDGRIWVDFKDGARLPRSFRRMESGTANVTLRGRFHKGSGQFGHIGRYEYLFVVESARRVNRIEAVGFHPEMLPPKFAMRVCGGE